MENKEIAVLNDYPESKFNLLIPIKTLQELSPLHKVVINQVQINSDVNKKEVYKEKNGELALTKKGLAKLMTAANIQMVESKPIPPQKCNRCAEIASKTKLAPKCYECPYVDDVAYQVTLAVPEPSGTWRKVTATKELRMSDMKESMKESQYKSFFPFRTEQCETKALNRALREALMINSTYRAQELQRPFVVAYIVPNMADEDMKKVMVQKYAESANMLFGGNVANTKQIAQSTNGPESVEAEIVQDDGTYCEKCGQLIKAGNGKWTVEKILEYSQQHFQKNLCIDCINESIPKDGDKND